MKIPKVTKEELVERIQSRIKEEGNTLLSKVLTSKIFDVVFEVVVSYIEEGKEVTLPHLGVLGIKDVPTTRRRNIGLNTFFEVPSYFRPKLRLNDALRHRCIDRQRTFLEGEVSLGRSTKEPSVKTID